MEASLAFRRFAGINPHPIASKNIRSAINVLAVDDPAMRKYSID